MGAAAAFVEPERARPRDVLAWLQSRHHLTQEHVTAGNHLLDRQERASRVAYSSPGSGGGGNLNPLEARATAQRQVERDIEMLGETGSTIVRAVVMAGMKLPDAAKLAGIPEKAALPVLTVCLDVLRWRYQLP